MPCYWLTTRLETFLGGMETEIDKSLDVEDLTLETFLGGMETLPSRRGTTMDISLETFLGGMETPTGLSALPG